MNYSSWLNCQGSLALTSTESSFNSFNTSVAFNLELVSIYKWNNQFTHARMHVCMHCIYSVAITVKLEMFYVAISYTYMHVLRA